MNWQHWVNEYGYLAVAIGTLFEGETVLLLAGLAVSQGQLVFSKVLMVAVCFSFIGDQCWFWIGRLHGLKLFRRFRKIADRIERMRHLIHRYHAPLILVNRFLYGLRAIGPALFGTSPLPAWQFACYDLLGAVLWSSVILGIGMSATQALHSMGKVGLIATGCVVVLAGAGYWWYRRRQRGQA